MNAILISSLFIVMTLLPQTLRANENDTKTHVRDCVSKIQKTWAFLNGRELSGQTRHQTTCAATMEFPQGQIKFEADGDPLEVNFQLGDLTHVEQSIQFCRVDSEKIHIVFEQKNLKGFERKEKVQLTLLKRSNNGLSMILSHRQLKVFLPTNQSNLICHLQL